MNQESTEAVLELCLQTQHENTKNAILKHLNEVCQTTSVSRMQQYSASDVLWLLGKVQDAIRELKLEDTK